MTERGASVSGAARVGSPRSDLNVMELTGQRNNAGNELITNIFACGILT